MTMLASSDQKRWLRDFSIATAAGLFFGLTGPFGNYLNGPVPGRLVYWLSSLWIGTVLFNLVLWSSVRLKLPYPAGPITATVLAAIPIAILSRIMARTLWPGPIDQVGPVTWYGQTLLITASLAICYEVARRVSDRPQRPPAPPPSRDFLGRLPDHLGRDLVALQMEDHYVRAHTRSGSTLILIPLHRAIAELDGVPGLKVHRSWWVARTAVTGAIRDGRNLRLRLVTGIDVPVARTSVAEARAAGLLADLS